MLTQKERKVAAEAARRWPTGVNGYRYFYDDETLPFDAIADRLKKDPKSVEYG